MANVCACVVWHTHVVLAAAPEHEVMGVVEKLRAVIVIDSPHAVVAVQEPDATIFIRFRAIHPGLHRARGHETHMLNRSILWAHSAVE